jgi:hypothetical protein
MATYQYCWLKVLKVPENDPPPTTDFGLWCVSQNYPGLVAATRASPPAMVTPNSLSMIVGAPCPTCPTEGCDCAMLVERFGQMTPPPLPSTVISGFVNGWQIETGVDPVPPPAEGKVYFAMHPVGSNRESALAWISDEGPSGGVAWVQGSMAVTLLSFITEP